VSVRRWNHRRRSVGDDVEGCGHRWDRTNASLYYLVLWRVTNASRLMERVAGKPFSTIDALSLPPLPYPLCP
jgi:hypothetical protein